MPLEVWIFLLGVIAILLFYFYRLGIANQQHLTEEQCDEFSWLVVDELFKSSPQIGYFVEVLSAYWRDIGLNDLEVVYLCRRMRDKGLVSLPDGWGGYDIAMNLPPEKLALTQKSWELIMNREIQPYISIGSIGDVNGPINVGGEQIVIYGQELSGEDLQALVGALRQDARGASEPRASSLREAADTLQDAVEGREPATSPAVTGALKWVRQCVSDAVSNAGGQALLTATVAAARALGWV